MRVASPRTRRRSVHASRNLSRAPAASLRDRLRRPWTEPACRKVPQQSGSGEGPGQDNGAARAPVQAWRQLGYPGSTSDMTGGHVAWRTRKRCSAPRMTVAAGQEGYENCRPVARSVNRFVNRTLRDSVRHGRRSRRARWDLSCPPRSPRPRETVRDARDTCRMAHNPEVAGSNPAPATNFRRSRPFPNEERAFCVSETVVKRVAETGLRAARQRDTGDGVARDETAWTWWTLPPAVAGCRAQRYHRQPPVSSCPSLTSRTA
jgi:hypothetical protein